MTKVGDFAGDVDHGGCVLQKWVLRMGLRHQGVLLAAVRGCDTLPKTGAAKTMARYLRSVVLNAHCGDARKAGSFMSVPSDEVEFLDCEAEFFEEYDALPFHYVMHLFHAAAIVGYHRQDDYGRLWLHFYARACRRMHVNPETREQLDARLSKDEAAFVADQK